MNRCGAADGIERIKLWRQQQLVDAVPCGREHSVGGGGGGATGISLSVCPDRVTCVCRIRGFVCVHTPFFAGSFFCLR